MTLGRPSIFTEELGIEICSRIANGMSLRKICEHKDKPHIDTVRNWLVEGDMGKTPALAAFSAQYVRAREEQADYYADEIIEIADTEKDPNKARVRVDARKWVASKLKSKRYGDKVDVTSAGEKIQPILGGGSVRSDNSNQENP